MEDIIKNAPSMAFKNKKILKSHNDIGCYHCLKVFKTEEIKNWTDNNETALCPYCSVDSVLTIINIDILKKCKEFWFKKL